jgi:ankyrin repeat protein
MRAKKSSKTSTPKKKRSRIPTPDIIMAASDGDLVEVKAELNTGTDVNVVDSSGGTALHQAACNHHTPVVKALLAAGADVRIADAGGWTALHFAARELQLDIAKLLLNAGAALDAKDEYGNTPLRRAILQREVFSASGAPAMIQLLRDAGADKKLRNPKLER